MVTVLTNAFGVVRLRMATVHTARVAFTKGKRRIYDFILTLTLRSNLRFRNRGLTNYTLDVVAHDGSRRSDLVSFQTSARLIVHPCCSTAQRQRLDLRRPSRCVNTAKRLTVVTQHLPVCCQLPFNSITSAILFAP